jgi:hypothetical protein
MTIFMRKYVRQVQGFPANATLFQELFSILFNNRYMFRSYDHLQAEVCMSGSGFPANATLF